jgi:hypothetical protein
MECREVGALNTALEEAVDLQAGALTISPNATPRRRDSYSAARSGMQCHTQERQVTEAGYEV